MRIVSTFSHCPRVAHLPYQLISQTLCTDMKTVYVIYAVYGKLRATIVRRVTGNRYSNRIVLRGV